MEVVGWLVPDTVDPLRYTYTDGDPVNHIDPSGRIWLEYGKNKFGAAPPRLAEDYFIEQTFRYATAGFNPYAGRSSSGAAEGAGDQAPVPAWESAYRAELARNAYQVLNDAMAEFIEADAKFAEASNQRIAEAAATIEAQAIADLAQQGRTAFDRMVLMDAQDSARTNPNFQPGHEGSGWTYCNGATIATVRAVGGPTGPLVDARGNALLANDIAHNLASSNEYKEVGPITAQWLANSGCLVIGAQENQSTTTSHGHVVTVRPTAERGDGVTKARGGPSLNNIGAIVDIMSANAVFPATPQVRYYTPRSP